VISVATLTYKFGEKIFLGNVDALTVIIDKLFGKPDASAIVFDLGNVRQCDSYGLKFLINYQRKANASHRKLLLYQPAAFLMKMLSGTKLLHFFVVTDKREDGSTDPK
jgi:anti-anti-sigma factor